MNEPRISKTTATLMVVVAIFFDLTSAGVNLIPVVGQFSGWFVTIFGYCSHWFWFSLKGVSVISPKQAVKTLSRFLGPAVLEALTFGIAPGLTLSVFLTIGQSRIEDRLNKRASQTAEEEYEEERMIEEENEQIESNLVEEELEEDLLEQSVSRKSRSPQPKPYDGDADRDTLEA